MSISPVSSSPPVVPPAPADSTPNKTLETSSDTAQQSQGDGSTEAYVYQPTPPVPLPPGQGTRVDQLA